jgi:hypothetical protein
MDQNIEIKILKQQIKDLKNKLFELTIVQSCDRNDDRFYPEETEGSRIAAEIRAVCNSLSDEERQEWRQKALDIIYKDCPEQDPRNKVIPANQELKDKMSRLAARPPVSFEQAKEQVDNTKRG